MSEEPQITTSDEGKTVVTQDGDEIGEISAVQNNAIVVEAPEDLGDSIRSRLDWDHTRGNKYMLQASNVDNVTDDSVEVSGFSEE